MTIPHAVTCFRAKLVQSKGGAHIKSAFGFHLSVVDKSRSENRSRVCVFSCVLYYQYVLLVVALMKGLRGD